MRDKIFQLLRDIFSLGLNILRLLGSEGLASGSSEVLGGELGGIKEGDVGSGLNVGGNSLEGRDNTCV